MDYYQSASPAIEHYNARIRLFGAFIRSIWTALFVATVTLEVLPRDPSWGPHLFYPYTACKSILFVLLGFATPLAIWKFNSLGLGILAAAVAAGAAEASQVFLVGHHASSLEFFAKLLLLTFGFALALIVRHDCYLNIGIRRIFFVDPHCAVNSKS